jgi:protein-tyrosine phosphatase
MIMRRIPDSSLSLGHVGDVRNLSGVLTAGILAVVDLALNEPPAFLTRDLVYCRFPLLDGSGNPRWLLRAAIETVAMLIRSNTPTLLYCGAGMSRSPAIAGAAVALVRDCSLDEGLIFVTRTGVTDVSPGLWSDIRAALAL